MLKSAKNRMDTTQQHLIATQELYIKASEQLLEQQNKLGEIQADITKLGQSQIGLVSFSPLLQNFFSKLLLYERMEIIC